MRANERLNRDERHDAEIGLYCNAGLTELSMGKEFLRAEAQAIALAVRAIRNAQGKKNASEFGFRSREWFEATEDFARDIQRFLGCASDERIGDVDPDQERA